MSKGTLGGRGNILDMRCRLTTLAKDRCTNQVFKFGYCKKHYRQLRGQ